MASKSNSVRYPQNRTDTRIGTGVQVAGNVTFTGVLLVEGGVLGDLSCDADTKGTLVVGPSGQVSGAIKAPHIVVSGRVSGPSDSSESIEIQSGACLVGDLFYKEIEVHAGGVVEGSLTPRPANDMHRAEPGRPVQAADARPAMARGQQRPDDPAAAAGLWQVPRGGRALGWAMALLIAVAAAIWANRDLPWISVPPAEVVLKSSDTINQPVPIPASPAEGGLPQDAAKLAAGDPVVPAPAMAAVPAPSATGLGGSDSDEVVKVQGVNPRKPAGIFSVTSKEPAVLIRKKRQDPAGGTSIEISAGATKTIPIAKDEIVRVAEGRNLMIFYQGKMVPPRTVESGAWMSFVPQPPDGANAND